MEILLYASAVIAALSLLLIAIFVVLTLKSAKQTMGEISDTMKRMETKVNGITDRSERLMDTTNRIADDAEKKMEAFDTLSSSAKEFGKSTNYMYESFRNLSYEISTPPSKYRDFIEKATALTETAARMFYTFKKEAKKHESDPQDGPFLPENRLPAPQKRIEYRN